MKTLGKERGIPEKRISVGELNLGSLKREYRFLTPEEVDYLRRI